MTRYIFNTSGDYVAFIHNGNLFDTKSNWLGVIKNGNEVYDVRGVFLGYVLDDDRIARISIDYKPGIMVPIRPLPPSRPVTPLQRLRMPPLLFPYEDIFANSEAIAKWKK